MQRFPLSHLTDQAVLRGAAAIGARISTTTAEFLAYIAEIDDRKLYRPAGYPSMFSYCMRELHLPEDAASKRIQAARVARRFPAVFDALAEDRLHLSGVVLLAPHLTEDSADDLLEAATHKSKSEIERLLAERFPRPDMLAWVEAIPAASADRSVEEHAPGHVGDRSRVKPLSPESFGVQFTMSRGAQEKLRYVQELLSHQIPSGDIAEIFERTLDLAIAHLEKRKFAATERPRSSPRSSTASSRHIPAPVRRTVWKRDGGRCTFVSESGHRCEARAHLEFDRTFGAELMRHKRLAATEARAEAKARADATRAQDAAAEQAHVLEVVPCLRQLGFTARESCDAAALCRDMRGASLEQRVRVALSYFRPRGTRRVRPGEGFGTAASLAGSGALGAGPGDGALNPTTSVA